MKDPLNSPPDWLVLLGLVSLALTLVLLLAHLLGASLPITF